jgi:hypothetical protein
MGFFKNLKSDHEDAKAVGQAAVSALSEATSAMAQIQATYGDQIHAAQSMMSQINPAKAMAMGQRLNFLVNNGIPGMSTVISAQALGPGESGNGTSVEFQLTLTSGTGAPRQVTVRQDMMGDPAAPGTEMPVLISPTDPNDVMIGSKPPTGGEDVKMMRLEQLAAMKASGALPDAKFQELKARILAED